jgi:hypothetical protein
MAHCTGKINKEEKKLIELFIDFDTTDFLCEYHFLQCLYVFSENKQIRVRQTDFFHLSKT